MRVLITGGCGFIGNHLATELRNRGHDLVAIDSLLPQVHSDPEAAIDRFPGKVNVGDVRDHALVTRVTSGCDATVHLAAETGVAQSETGRDHYVSVNVEGTRVVATTSAIARVPLLLASSRAVYGEGAFECSRHGRRFEVPCCAQAAPAPSRENDALAPISVYGQTKAEAEAIVTRLRPTDHNWVIVRPQNVVGPGQAPHNPYTGVLAAFAARLRAGLPPVVYGDGSATRDFIDVRDTARVLSDLVEHSTRPESHWSAVVNIGSGCRTTLQCLAEAAVRASGKQVGIEHAEINRPGDIHHACADLSRFDALGLPRPSTPLSTSVADFIRSAWAEPAIDPAIWDRVIAGPAAG